MITENLSTLKIHKLTDEQYEREFEAGRIDENAIYITPSMAEGGTNIPITSTPEEDIEIWIDPDVDAIGAAVNAVSDTMLAENWVENTYSFEDTYPKAKYNIEIQVAPTATVEQFEAFGEAMICGSHDTNNATAIGGAPTVDIPIIVTIFTKVVSE